MPGKQLDANIKEGAIKDVRHHGLSVAGTAAKWGVSTRTVYGWLREEVAGSGRNLILENNRLRRELEQAYRLLGRATAELKREKNSAAGVRQPGFAATFLPGVRYFQEQLLPATRAICQRHNCRPATADRPPRTPI